MDRALRSSDRFTPPGVDWSLRELRMSNSWLILKSGECERDVITEGERWHGEDAKTDDKHNVH